MVLSDYFSSTHATRVQYEPHSTMNLAGSSLATPSAEALEEGGPEDRDKQAHRNVSSFRCLERLEV